MVKLLQKGTSQYKTMNGNIQVNFLRREVEFQYHAFIKTLGDFSTAKKYAGIARRHNY